MTALDAQVARRGAAVRIRFPHRRAGHCGSGALRDLLEHRELSFVPAPLSEEMVFGLSGALTFLFAEHVVLPDCPDVRLPLYLNGRAADLERDLCAHLEIALDVRETDDPDEGWAWLRAELDAGNPTMVWANMRELDYLNVRLDNSRHDIVVTGYDLDRGVAFVADHDRDEIVACSLTSLASARSSRAFPGPVRNAAWVMRFPDRLPEPGVAIAAALRRAVANMRGRTDATLPYLSGLAAVERFVESYASWPERFGDGLRSPLKLLNVLVTKAGTGGALFRSFQSRFLAESAALLADDRLRAAAGRYDELAVEWTAFATAVRSGQPLDAHRAGAARLDRIARLETEAVAMMADCLEPRRRPA